MQKRISKIAIRAMLCALFFNCLSGFAKDEFKEDFQQAQQLIRQKDYSGAEELLQQLLQQPGLPARLHCDTLLLLIQNHIQQQQRSQAHQLDTSLQKLFHEKILPADEFSVSDKFNYGLKLYERHTAASDDSAADELFGQLQTLPGLTRKDLLRLRNALADNLLKRGEGEQTLAVHQETLQWPDLTAAEKLGVYQQLANLQQRSFRNPDRLREVLESMLKLELRDPGMKNRLLALARFKAPKSSYNNPENVEFAWEQYLALPALNPSEREDALLSLIAVRVERRKYAEAMEHIQLVTENSEFSVTGRTIAGLLALGLPAAQAGTDLSDAQINQALAVYGQLKNAEMYKALNQAGASLKFLGEGHLARRLQQRAEALVAQAQRTQLCRYLEAPPAGAGDWLSHIDKVPAEFIAGNFRDYNTDHAKTLEADVAAERSTGSADERRKAWYVANTSFTMAFDEKGWHIFVLCGEENLQQKKLQRQNLGALEFFFAPGPEKAYYQWIVSLDTGKTECYNWNTPHRSFRLQDSYIRSETAAVVDRMGTYIFFPWELLYDVLPFESDQPWLFQLIRWSPAGGLAWTGGRVHATGEFGRVNWQQPTAEFKEHLQMRLLTAAWSKFQNSCQTEITEKWASRDFGDPDFLKNCLQADLDRLNQYGKILSATAKPEKAVLQDLWQNALLDWMNFKYLCAEKRHRFLQEQILQE